MGTDCTGAQGQDTPVWRLEDLKASYG